MPLCRVVALGLTFFCGIAVAEISLSPNTMNFEAGGGSSAVQIINTEQSITWSATVDVDWVQFTSAASGTGNGNVNYVVAGNPYGAQRTATVTVKPGTGNSKTLVITQRAGELNISPSSANVQGTGGGDTLTVNTNDPSLQWTASSAQSWLKVVSGATGTGPGSVVWTAAANTEVGSRTGTITVTPVNGVGRAFVVSQQGGTPPAGSISISSSSISLDAAGSNGSIQVTATVSSITWTTGTVPSWLTITSGSGTGSGAFSYSASANPSATARTTTITVTASQGPARTLAVSQSGGVLTVNPLSASAGAEGGSGTISLGTTDTALVWRAASSPSWLTVGAATGAGAGTLSWTAASNISTAGRSGQITITPDLGNAITFSLDQGGISPGSFTISPTTADAPASSSSNSVKVSSAIASLPWTSASNQDWLHITSGSSGVGNGSIGYSVDGNDMAAPRTGVITVIPAAGPQVTLTVTQARGFLSVTSPPTATAAPTGGTGSFDIKTNNTTLVWTASVVSTASTWLTITSATSGAGSTTMTWSASANATTVQRSATIQVLPRSGANTIFTITQGPLTGTLVVSADSLTFSYQLGGTIPGAKQITAGSVPSGLAFTARASTATGGQWLHVSEPTSGVVTVSVTPAALEAGQYEGAITFTSASATNSPVTVPVILTVTPIPILIARPNPLTFDFQQNGPTPPSQPVTLLTSGGQLDYTIVPDPNAPWLAASGPGPAPSGLIVSVTPGSLGVGVYQGVVTLRSTAAGNSPLQIPVSLRVSAASNLVVTPGSLALTVHELDPAPPPIVLGVTSTDSSSLSFRTATTASWLTVSGAGNTTARLQVSIDPTKLTAATYQASIVLTSDQAGNRTLVIPVVLTVLPGHALNAEPAALTFSLTQGGGARLRMGPIGSASTSVTVSSDSPIPFTVSEIKPANSWLTVASSGATTTNILTVSAQVGDLIPGTYDGTIKLTSSAAINSPLIIPVTLTVSAQPQLTLGHDQLSFTYQLLSGPTQLPAQSISVATPAPGAAVSAVAASSPGTWLTAGGGITTPGAVRVAVDAAGLNAGIYTGTVTLTAPGYAPASVPVTLTVADAPLVTVQPLSLEFSFQQGGTFPPPQSVAIGSSSSGSPLLFASLSDGNNSWLSVTGGGQTPDRISVSVNPTRLSPGLYRGAVAVTSEQAGNRAVRIPVTLNVTLSSPVLTQPASLTFMYTQQRDVPPAQSISVSSAQTLAFTSSVAGDQAWLRLKGGGSTPSNLEASVDPTGLAPGLHAASILINAPGAEVNPIEVPAVLIVNPAPRLNASLKEAVFSYQTGGDPATNQPLVISSSDSSLIVTGTPSTETGGSWLSITGGGNVSPATFSLSVNTSGLRPGTYHGSVTFHAQGAENTVTLPVTLVVAAAPSLRASPSQLQLAYQIGAIPPSTASVEVASTGTPLSFGATASTDSGGPWLAVSSGGTTRSLLTVTLVPGGLEPGTYTGKIEIASTGAGNSPLLIPVTLTVTTSLALGSAPNSLHFSAQAGAGQPSEQAVRITSSGTPVPITYSTTTGARWLTVTGAGPAPADLVVSVSTAGLTAGSYSALILVQSTLAANNPLEIPVTLDITAAPVLQITPAVLRYSYVVSGTKPLPQSFSVGSSGAPLAYSAAVVDSPPWLFSSGSGTTTGMVNVAVDPGSLDPGEYQGTMLVTSPSISSVAFVQVILTVSAAPVITVQPTQLNFAYQLGSPNPVSQSMVVRSDSSPVVVLDTVQSFSGGNWLRVSGSGVTPAVFSAAVDPTGLAPGTYKDQITFRSADLAVAPIVAVVALTVTSAPVLVSQPNVVVFTAQTGGAAPPNRQITVAASDNSALAVTAQSSFGMNWLTVTSNSNVTPAVFTVSVTPAGLSEGVYYGSIVFSSSAGGVGSQVVPINFTVGSRPSVRVSPAAISFAASPSGLSPAPVQAIVSGSGDTPIAFTSAAGAGAPWLSVAGSGTTPSGITIAVNTAGLAPGAYHGSVFVTAPGAANSPIGIPVDLQVSSAPLLTASPSGLTLNSPLPTQARFTIAGTAPGIAFSAVPTSGTAWLKIAATGVTPQDVYLSVDSAGLSPGTYQGAIQVTAAGAGNSPLLVPVTLNVTAIPALTADPSPISFSYNSSNPFPQPQSVSLAVGGVPASAAQATVPPGSSWLSVQRAGNGTVTVTANPSGLLPGNYTGSVQVTNPGASNSPLTIPVSISVSGFPTFDVSQTSVAFAALPEQTDPVSTTLMVGGNSATPFDVAFDVTGSTWLSITPLGGRTPLTISITAHPAGLRPGIYTGSIAISSNGNTIRTVPVTLAIAPPSSVTISPQFLVFNYLHGGDVPDPTDVYFLRFNREVAVTASTSDSWIILNPLTPSQSGPVTVGVNPISLTSGTYHGLVTFTISELTTGAPVITRQVPVDLYVDQPAAPRILTVSNGMSFLASTLAPGLVFSILGTGLGPTLGAVGQPDPQTHLFTRSLEGVQVSVNGILCPVLYASDMQINAIAPYSLYTKDSATVAVRRNGVLSNEVPVHVSPASPGLFSTSAGGAGQGAILNQDQSFNSSQNPAAKGSIISLFGSGDGQSAPQGIDGVISTAPLPAPLLPVSVFIGGIPASYITYSGAAPTLVAGVLQVNVRIPNNVPSGNVPVVIVVGGTSSQQGLTVSVR